ncbi:MAG: CBS domain-containing protein [Saprospiraceae bacterium]
MKNFKQKPRETTNQIVIPKVTEYMVTKLITFTPDTEIKEVIETLTKHKITGAPVLDNHGNVVGLIDDKDCLNVLTSGAYYNLPTVKETVSNYMSNVMKTISTNEDIMNVAYIFLRTPYKRLLVLDDNGKLAGQISRYDVLLAIKDIKANTW